MFKVGDIVCRKSITRDIGIVKMGGDNLIFVMCKSINGEYTMDCWPVCDVSYTFIDELLKI